MKFSCARAPFLRLGDRVAFDSGVFETEDPELISLVQSNDWFGFKILEDPNAKPTVTAAPMRLGTTTTHSIIDRTTLSDANRRPEVIPGPKVAPEAAPKVHGAAMTARLAKAAATRARHNAEKAALAKE